MRHLPGGSSPSFTGPTATRCRRNTRKAEHFKHPAHLAVFALGQHELRLAAGVVGGEQSGAPGFQKIPLVAQANRELLQCLRLEPLGQRHAIGLEQAVARVRHLLAKLAIVGQQDQPLAVGVEPADGEEVPPVCRQQVEHRPAIVRVVAGAEKLRGLVEGDEPLGPGPDRAAVERHFVPGGINLRAKQLDDLAIDGDATGEDQLFAFTAGSHSGLGEKFLQANHHHGGGKCGAVSGGRATEPGAIIPLAWSFSGR